MRALIARLPPVPVALLLGISVGLIALRAGELETRWGVALLASAVLAPAIPLLWNRSLLEAAMVISLQANLCVTQFQQPGGYVGRSGAAGLEIYITTLLALGVLAVHAYSIRGIGRLKASGVLGQRMLFVFATMAASIVLANEKKSAIFTLLNWGQCYLSYLVALNCVRTEGETLRVTRLLLWVTLIQAGVYFIQYATGATFTLTGEVIERGMTRYGGTVSTHVSGFGEFMNLLVPIAVALYVGSADKRIGRLAAWAAGLGAIGIVLSFTRAAWLAFIVSTAVLGVMASRRGLLRAGSAVKSVAAMCVIVVVLAGAIGQVFDRDHEGDYDERSALSQMALRVIVANPVVGVGLGTYGFEFRRYLTAELSEKWQYVVHNWFLLRAAETGVIGLVALVMWYMAVLRLCWRLSKLPRGVPSALGLGLFAALIGVAVEFCFDVGSVYPVHNLMWFQVGLVEAVGLRLLPRERA